MSPIEVLCVCEPPASGVPVYVEQIVRRLEGGDFHFTVACPEDSILRKKLADTAVDIADVPLRPLTLISAAKSSAQIWRLLHRKRFNVVHLHSSKAGLLGRPLCGMLGIQTAFTPHCFSFESVRSSKIRFASYLSAEWILGRWTGRLACVSDGERELALRYGIVPDARILVIPCFADSVRWQPRPASAEARRELGIPQDSSVVGTISRFHPQKAPRDFVSMAEMLLKSRPQTRFLFAGEDGPLRAEVEEFTRRAGLLERVIFRIWPDNVQELVALMDVVVLNSLWEGLPLSLIEAMSMGKPFVATDLPGPRELIARGRCGILVPRSDCMAMAKAVESLLACPELSAVLGENGRRIANEHYTVEQAAKKTAELYWELAQT